MRKIFILFYFFTIFIIIGCGTKGYGSNNYIRHVYITNTQKNGHILSGVEIKFKGNANNTIVGYLGQMLFLTKIDITIYIDREKVDTFDAAASNYETFVKLPPGIHEFAYRVSSRGFLTLGVSTDDSFYVYKFEVPKAIATITIYPEFKNKKTRELYINFSRNINYHEIIGKCHNDFTTCNPI
jgi:hypothetical protein